MPSIKDMEMPGKEAPEMEEDFDFGLDEEIANAEEAEAPDLESISDDILIEEMKKRGFDVEDVAEEDEGAEPEAPADDEMEAPIV
jgi:hypothetical protein